MAPSSHRVHEPWNTHPSGLHNNGIPIEKKVVRRDTRPYFDRPDPFHAFLEKIVIEFASMILGAELKFPVC